MRKFGKSKDNNLSAIAYTTKDSSRIDSTFLKVNLTRQHILTGKDNLKGA